MSVCERERGGRGKGREKKIVCIHVYLCLRVYMLAILVYYSPSQLSSHIFFL